MTTGKVEIIHVKDGVIHRSVHEAEIAEDRSTVEVEGKLWWAEGSGQYYSQYADIYNGHRGDPSRSVRIL